MNANQKTNRSHSSRQLLWSLFLIASGNFLYALTVRLFLLPAGLITGGSTGIALTVNHLSGLSISFFVLLFNILMLSVGYLCLGKKFALTTALSTFLYPLFLALLDLAFKDTVITEDLLLCTVFSGLGIGLSLSMVIRAGASTGGMDIPPLVLNKYFKLPVSVGLYLFDVLILLAQFFYRSPETILYGILLVLIYSIVVDKMLFIGASKMEIKIISEYSDDIREEILQQLDRGVTMLSGEGGYLHFSTQIIMTVVSGRELPKVERLARSIDPECFVVITRVNEVNGRGFSLNKKYK
ncbi:MAG: YitT family protein [Lachnospiraceae bacterium]|nr:YitT family protein [Lachnospiraceae bacterium]